ncbi:10891_t:CDS:1, partial [Racocetra persica]
NWLNLAKLEDIAKIYAYYISNANTELKYIAATIKLDELCQKILDVTVSIELKDKNNKNDIAIANEIKEFYILEKNEYNNISIK